MSSVSSASILLHPTPDTRMAQLSNVSSPAAGAAAHPKQPRPTTDTSDGQRLVSVSTTFFPGATLDTLPPDLILLSADSVFFNVHSHRLLAASDNGFGHLLPAAPKKARGGDPHAPPDPDPDQSPIVSVPESSEILNLVLHAVYGLSCTHYVPALDTLVAAGDTFGTYGLSARAVVAPGAPLFDALLLHAPVRALDVYVFAARHDLLELAVLTSSHLLSLQLAGLTDEVCAAMGAVYLKRLFFLHLGRADALKRLLLMPPPAHTPTQQCGFEERGKLTRAWALAAAYLAWDSRPGALGTCSGGPDHMLTRDDAQMCSRARSRPPVGRCRTTSAAISARPRCGSAREAWCFSGRWSRYARVSPSDVSPNSSHADGREPFECPKEGQNLVYASLGNHDPGRVPRLSPFYLPPFHAAGFSEPISA